MSVQRQATRKFVTRDAQGPGSWIIFRIPTWDETKQAVKDMRDRGRQYVGSVKNASPLDNMEMVAAMESSFEDFLWSLAMEKFDSWNWVDANGAPLPPLTGMSPGDLLNTEIEAIVTSVQTLYQISDEDKDQKKDRRT